MSPRPSRTRTALAARLARPLVVAAVAVATLVVGVAPSGPWRPAPAGAVASDPPTVVDLPLSEAWAVDEVFASALGRERVFVLGPEGVAVVGSGGAVEQLLPISGDALVAGDRNVFVLDQQTATVTMIDPNDLSTRSVELEGVAEVEGLAAGRPFHRTTAWVTAAGESGARRIVEVDVATGDQSEVATGLGDAPLSIEISNGQLIAVQLGSASTTGYWRFGALWPLDPLVLEDTGSLPIGGVEAVAADTLGILVVAADEVVAYLTIVDAEEIDRIDLAPATPAVVEGGPYEWITTAGPDDGTLTLGTLTLGDPGTARELTAGLRTTGAQIDRQGDVVSRSKQTSQLYAVGDGGSGPAQLRIWSLAPSVDDVWPRAVSRIWGPSRITISGRGLAGASGPGAVVRSSDAELVVDANLDEEGGELRRLTVFGPLGDRATGDPRVRVLDLGPFGDGAELADGAYRDALGRTATAAEQRAVDAQIFTDGLPGSVFADLSRTDAARGPEAKVLRLYQALLGRWADDGGLTYWAEVMRSGRSLGDVARAFARSPEFAGGLGTVSDRAFVVRLYERILGRAAEPAGVSYWVAQLGAGRSRGLVAMGFSESPEHRTLTAADVDVSMLWRVMLDRLPRASERQQGVAHLLAGNPLGTLAASVLVGEEYRAAHP